MPRVLESLGMIEAAFEKGIGQFIRPAQAASPGGGKLAIEIKGWQRGHGGELDPAALNTTFPEDDAQSIASSMAAHVKSRMFGELLSAVQRGTPSPDEFRKAIEKDLPDASSDYVFVTRDVYDALCAAWWADPFEPAWRYQFPQRRFVLLRHETLSGGAVWRGDDADARLDYLILKGAGRDKALVLEFAVHLGNGLRFGMSWPNGSATG